MALLLKFVLECIHKPYVGGEIKKGLVPDIEAKLKEHNMTKTIGMKKILKSSVGWAVFTLCPMNTSNPQPNNAFWQQSSKEYSTIGRCIKYTGVTS